MAATIARATGHDSVRSKRVHRLGSHSSAVQAATYQTFAEAVVYADGSGEIRVRRNGRTFCYDFGPETERLPGARNAAVRSIW